MHYQHVAIEGNIGSGKTTLARSLAEEYGAELVLEAFEANPFLPKFYEDPEKHAFPVELFFLAERYHQLKEQAQEGGDLFKPFTISDYFIQKSLIFAGNNLKGDEYQLFDRLFRIMYESLPKPDLVLYLHKEPDQLQKNILSRGREFELELSEDYLRCLQEAYFSFFRQHPELRVAVVDCKDLDFVERFEDRRYLKGLLDLEMPKGVNFFNGQSFESSLLKD